MVWLLSMGRWTPQNKKNLSLLRTGKKSLAGNSPPTRCSQNRHMKGFAEGVGPFERNWHPEGFTPPKKNCTWNEGDWLHRHNDVASIHWFTRFIRKTHLKNNVSFQTWRCHRMISVSFWTFNKTFHVQELGYYTWNEAHGRHAFFIPLPYKTLDYKERRTVNFFKNKIHGLTCQPTQAKHF